MLPGLPARQPSPTESTHEPKAPKPSTLDPELALNPQPLKPKPKLTEKDGIEILLELFLGRHAGEDKKGPCQQQEIPKPPTSLFGFRVWVEGSWELARE